MFSQEIAGYRLTHHSQLDTVDRAIEPNLVQGGQVMAVTALRIANLDEPTAPRQARSQTGQSAEGGEEAGGEGRPSFSPDDLGKLVGVSDPQISPDGKSIVVVVGRPNYDKNRTDTRAGARGHCHGQAARADPRPSQRRPSRAGRRRGDRLAFLATAGESARSASARFSCCRWTAATPSASPTRPTGVQHYAWKPDGSAIAYAAADEPANKKEIEKGNDAFEVGNNDFLSRPSPSRSTSGSSPPTAARRAG